MNDHNQVVGGQRALSQFEYRIVYLKPSDYSEERIAVGLVASGRECLETKFLAAKASLDLMSGLFGDDGLEQFQFAATEMRRLAGKVRDLASLKSPTDLFEIGCPNTACTYDRTGLLTSVLESASCLIRYSTSRSRETFAPSSSDSFHKELRSHVTLLNPGVANRIFSQTYTVPTGEKVDLPILGINIFGAPVSFASSDQKTKGESYIAKFHWIRRYVSQQPLMYLLAPAENLGSKEASIRELRAIAEAADVPVRISDSAEGLATSIVRDEVEGNLF